MIRPPPRPTLSSSSAASDVYKRQPAKLAGVLSEGMLLCAEDAEGNLALMTPEKNMPAGAEIC